MIVYTFGTIQKIGGREFAVGVTLRQSILVLLQNWNQSPIYSTSKYDYQFVQFLLIEAFGSHNLAKNDLDDTKLEFLKGKIDIDYDDICVL